MAWAASFVMFRQSRRLRVATALVLALALPALWLEFLVALPFYLAAVLVALALFEWMLARGRRSYRLIGRVSER